MLSRSVLFNLHIFWNYPAIFLLLISSLIPLWFEIRHYMIFISLFYGPECGPHWRVFFVSLRRVCILLKLLYSVVLVSAVQQNELAVYMRVKVAESPLTLCDPTHGLYIVHGILQVRILEWVAIYSLLQGICPTQGSNPGLPHCRWILYQLSHRGSLYIYPLFFWISILFRLPEH